MRNTSRLLFLLALLSFGVASPTTSHASSFSDCIRIVLDEATVYGATLEGIRVSGKVYQTCKDFNPRKPGQYLPKYKLNPDEVICSGPRLRSTANISYSPGLLIGQVICAGGSFNSWGSTESYVKATLTGELVGKLSNVISHDPIGKRLAPPKSALPIPTKSAAPTPEPTNDTVGKDMPIPPKPVVSGSFAPGGLLVASLPGVSVADYDLIKYQWYRGCTPEKNCSGSFAISGANSATYLVKSDDVNWGIFVNVLFEKKNYNAYGTSSGNPGSVVVDAVKQVPTPTPTRSVTPTQTPVSIPLNWVTYPSANFCPNQPFTAEVGFGGSNGGLVAGLTIEFNFSGKKFYTTTNRDGKAAFSYTATNESTLLVSARYLGSSTIKAVESSSRSAKRNLKCALGPTKSVTLPPTWSFIPPLTQPVIPPLTQPVIPPPTQSVIPMPTQSAIPTPTQNSTDLYITSDQNFRAGQSYPARAALAQNSGPIAGATITFYINGKAFSAVTDSRGVALYNFSTKKSDTALSIYAKYGGNSTLIGSMSSTRIIKKL